MYDSTTARQNFLQFLITSFKKPNLSFLNLFQTSLRDARNSVSSSVVFYDAKDVDDEEIYQEVFFLNILTKNLKNNIFFDFLRCLTLENHPGQVVLAEAQCK